MAARLLGYVLALSLVMPASGAGENVRVAVVVHPDRLANLSIDDIAQMFLRRKRFWDDGTPVVPLNLPSRTSLREIFSTMVLRSNDARLAAYWNRRYFDGVLPPPTLASTEAVRRYVATDPNAIGYVPVSEVDRTVRVVLDLR